MHSCLLFTLTSIWTLAVCAQTTPTLVTLRGVQPTGPPAASAFATSLAINRVGTGVGSDGATTYSYQEVVTKQVIFLPETTITNTEVATVSGVFAIGESVYRFSTVDTSPDGRGIAVYQSCSMGTGTGMGDAAVECVKRFGGLAAQRLRR